MDRKKKRKTLGAGEKLEDRIAPSIIGGVAGIDEVPEFEQDSENRDKSDSSNDPTPAN